MTNSTIAITSLTALARDDHDEALGPDSVLYFYKSLTFIVSYIFCCLVCLISIMVSMIAIVKCFMHRESKLKKKLQLIMSFCLIFWAISNICWTINMYFGITPDLYNATFVSTQLLGVYFSVFGYVCFIVSFWMRMVQTVSDSMFAISNMAQILFKSAIIVSLSTFLYH